MNYIDELKDRAALIAFQFLLGQNEYKAGQIIDIDKISVDAWEMADRFMNQRPPSETITKQEKKQ